MDDRRKRPWRKLRVIVEVTVPPNSRVRERDLAYAVNEALPGAFMLPRPIHKDAREAVIRVKAFSAFWPNFLRLEKGIVNFRKKRKDDNE